MDQDHILGTDAVFAGAVYGRFVTHHHARFQDYRVFFHADALRPFMYVQAMADAVAGSVQIVDAGIPQSFTGEGVDQAAPYACGEFAFGNSDSAFQARVKSFFICSLGSSQRAIVRVMSVVPSKYWAPESSRYKLSVFNSVSVSGVGE